VESAERVDSFFLRCTSMKLEKNSCWFQQDQEHLQ